jgi:FtsH-binding integral membrane protein
MLGEKISVIKAAEPTFLSKVMFFFGLALLTSAAGSFVGFNYWIPLFIANPAIIWMLFAAELMLMFTARLWSARKPVNYILFVLFAFVTGLTLVPILVSTIMEFGGPALIIKALLATTLTFAAAAILGWVTGRNLMGLSGFLFFSLLGMIIVSLVGIFIPWGNTFEMVFSGFGVVIFGAYTMYDIQRLKIFPDDRPIDAALMLYLDIFNLFIYILRLMSAGRRN